MSYYFGNWETRGKYCHLELKCTQASRRFLRMHIKKQHLNRTDTYSLIWTPPVMINIDCARIYFHKKKHSYIYQRNKQGWLFSGTMSHLVTSNAAFLKILYSTDTKQRKALIKTMTENQQQALCEVILNVVKGPFHLLSTILSDCLRIDRSFINWAARR